MTTLFDKTVTCALCGAQNKITGIGSTNAFGSMDLDMRPPPMERDLVKMSIHECRECGYCAPDLASSQELGQPDITSEGYREARSEERFEKAAQQYRAYAFLARKAGNARLAAWGYLQAAWVCDDLKCTIRTAAIECRQDVLQHIADLHSRNATYTQDANTDFVLRLDLLRRTGQFAAVIQEVDALDAKRFGSPLTEIVRYQRSLAVEHDAGCHRVADAFPKER